jgi:hypothetical protein
MRRLDAADVVGVGCWTLGRGALESVPTVQVKVGAADFDDGERVAETGVLGAEASRHCLCASGSAAQSPEFVVTGGMVDP